MNSAQDIGERLKIARKHAGFPTAREAAASLGIRYPTYAAHENGSRGVVRAADQYARRYRVSLDWLLRGRGAGPGEDDNPPSDEIVRVPLLARISAGAFQRDDLADEQIGTITLSQLPKGEWFALEVEGDSMDRISPPGSTIIVNRADQRLVSNACYVFADQDGNSTYKRYRPNPDRLEPVSTNPIHEPIFPDRMPTIFGRVYLTMLRM